MRFQVLTAESKGVAVVIMMMDVASTSETSVDF